MMPNIVTALFPDSVAIGSAVEELERLGLSKSDEIAVVTKDIDVKLIDTTTNMIKDDAGSAATTGATAGAVIGGIGALLVGLTAIVIPGLNIVATGWLASMLLGAASGAITGGLIGALVDIGFDQPRAQEYERRISAGEAMVAVETDDSQITQVSDILRSKGATEIETLPGKAL
jgi:uncharacterized membrane protein